MLFTIQNYIIPIIRLNTTLKRRFNPERHNLLMSSQTCLVFLLWNTKEEIFINYKSLYANGDRILIFGWTLLLRSIVVAKIIITPDRSEKKFFLAFLASKTWFHFTMFMKHADGCSEHNKYQMKWVILFLSTFNFNIWYVHFFSNYSSTPLWHSVNIFPENFNTNVVSYYILKVCFFNILKWSCKTNFSKM